MSGTRTAYDRGPQMFDPALFSSGGGYTTQTGIVARAGGGRPLATPLTACINLITVCATLADSVALPPAVGGQMVFVINGGAFNAQVFAAVGTSDTINGIAGATGVVLAGKELFASPAPGQWYGVFSA
jgi:hypothetical protein